MQVTLRLSHLIAALGAGTLAPALLSVGQDVVIAEFPGAGLERVWRLDDDVEVAIPTWLATSVMLINALALAALACHKLARRDVLRWHWLCLTVLFAGLSLDEVAASITGCRDTTSTSAASSPTPG